METDDLIIFKIKREVIEVLISRYWQNRHRNHLLSKPTLYH